MHLTYPESYLVPKTSTILIANPPVLGAMNHDADGSLEVKFLNLMD